MPALILLLATAAFVPTLHEGDTVPAIPLVDQGGEAFSLGQLRGNAVVLTFIYTRCADLRMCPLVTTKFSQLQRAIGSAPIHLVEVTLDPAFDTPQVLRGYGRFHGQDPARWTLATGAAGSINDFAARFGIATAWTSPGTLVHTEGAIVLDRSGTIARIVDGNAWTPRDLLATAREAAGDDPAPLARVRLWLTAAVERCGGGAGSINVIEAFGVFSVFAAAFAALLLRSLVHRHPPPN